MTGDGMEFGNTYEDASYAAAYAKLEFPGTYSLAYRDLPRIIATHVSGGTRALDFGCGAGRSTRFLRRCGFEVVGVDIAADMIGQALKMDPAGDYRLMPDGDFAPVRGEMFDLVLSAFTFDNIATVERKVRLLRGIRDLLAPSPGGRMVNVVSSPEMYVNEWASFSTRDFPENARASSGDVVRIVNLAIADRTPCEDVLWTDDAYREVYRSAGLGLVEAHRPLADGSEPEVWVSETAIAPWVIYVLEAAGSLQANG